MIKPKKAQLISEVFKYVLIVVVSIAILISGYKLLNLVKERTCKIEIAKFEVDLRNIDKSLRFGAKELRKHIAPCNIDRIYFFDRSKKISPENFDEVLIKDALRSESNNNVFLVKEGDVKRSFYTGNLEIIAPYYKCFMPKFEKISFFVENVGNSVKITGAKDQPECTIIPINISQFEGETIIEEAAEFRESTNPGCAICPTILTKEDEKEKIESTKNGVDIARKFSLLGSVIGVEIVIKPKIGSKLKKFKFYESIPKDCVDELEKYLVDIVKGEGDVFIKGDPLIMWSFSDLDEQKTVSYKLNTSLDEDCKYRIKGLGIAESIEHEEEINKAKK